MKHKKRKLIIFLVFGSLYLDVEVFARVLCMSLVGFNGLKAPSLAGWTTLWMFPIGGLCGLIIGELNDYNKNYNLKIWQQTIMGGSIITFIELVTGIFFNLILHLNLWDYSNEPFNFLGQISLKTSIIWYMLVGCIIWLDDMLQYYLYREGSPYSLGDIYVRLLKFK